MEGMNQPAGHEILLSRSGQALAVGHEILLSRSGGVLVTSCRCGELIDQRLCGDAEAVLTLFREHVEGAR